MLLMIVLANTPWYLYGSTPGLTTVHPDEGSPLDRVDPAADHDLRRLAGIPDVRVPVRLRNGPAVLPPGRGGVPEKPPVACCAAQRVAARLRLRARRPALDTATCSARTGWPGWSWWHFLQAQDPTLLIWAIVLTGLLTLSMLARSLAACSPPADRPTNRCPASWPVHGARRIENYLESIVARLTFWPFLVLFQGLLDPGRPHRAAARLLGRPAAILEEPGAHLPLLRRVAVVGSGGRLGLPAWCTRSSTSTCSRCPTRCSGCSRRPSRSTGLFGGLGYVALFGLIAHRIAGARDRPPGPRWR